jgi:hypothetical protein
MKTHSNEQLGTREGFWPTGAEQRVKELAVNDLKHEHLPSNMSTETKFPASHRKM